MNGLNSFLNERFCVTLLYRSKQGENGGNKKWEVT